MLKDTLRDHRPSNLRLDAMRQMLFRIESGPSYDDAGISSHHWHHQFSPTRILSFGCQQ